jgi:mono/diheme cytochrome c family protein
MSKILSAAVLFAFIVFTQPPAQAQGLPDGEGKAAIEQSCNLCHGLNYITQSGRGAEEWRNLVSDMVSRGAPLTKEEFEQVVKYLATHFGSKSPQAAAPQNQEKAASASWIRKLLEHRFPDGPMK